MQYANPDLWCNEPLTLFQLVRYNFYHRNRISRDIRGVYLCLIFEMSIWEFITNSKKKNQFRNKLDFLSSSNLIFTACVAC